MTDTEILDYLQTFDTVSVMVTSDMFEDPEYEFASGCHVGFGVPLRTSLIKAIEKDKEWYASQLKKIKPR